MKHIIKVSFFLFFVTCPLLSIGAGLNDEMIHGLVSQYEKAAKAQDISLVVDTLSEEVEIKSSFTAQGQTQHFSMTKQEYIDNAKESWALTQNYRYKVKDIAIEYINEEKASVKSTVTESMTIGPQYIKTTTKEVMIVELVDGSPLITKITGSTRMH